MLKDPNQKLSLLVGLRNNLEYTKNFYNTTRALYPDVEIVLVSYGSTDGTNEALDLVAANDVDAICFHSDENKTFSDTYNKAIELSTGTHCIFIHNDIVLAPGFLENIEKHINFEEDNAVISYTTIEPPIFEDHHRAGKLIADYGRGLEDFDNEAFLKGVEEFRINSTSQGAGFFSCIPKYILDDLGGFDNLYNPMFCEDDDLLKRLDLYEVNKFTALDAICYHFVSKTSRFSEEYAERTKAIEFTSIRNKSRKWGLVDRKFDIGVYLKDIKSSPSLLAFIEPAFDNIYYNDEDAETINAYINDEQLLTKFDLRKKFILGEPDMNQFVDGKLVENSNEIIITFDLSKLDQVNYDLLLQILNHFIENGLNPGNMSANIFQIKIGAYAVDRTSELVVLNTEYYQNKLL